MEQLVPGTSKCNNLKQEIGANSLFFTELLMLRASTINPFTTYKRKEQIALINYEAVRVALNKHANVVLHDEKNSNISDETNIKVEN